MRWTFSPAVVPARRLGAAGFFLVFVMGFFSRLKSGLARTRVNLVGLFSGGVVDEEFFESLEETLIAADIGYKPTSVILQRLRDTVKLKGLKTREEVRAALRDEIERILLPAQKPMNLDAAKPLVIMMAGVNGAGKTTTIGKIAKWLAAQNKTVLLAAADTFRAAAIEQLDVWGQRAGVPVIKRDRGSDPASVCYDVLDEADKRGSDLVLIDTAGRLHTSPELMRELAKVVNVTRKRAAKMAAGPMPVSVVLVIDAATGQNGLNQALEFNEALGLDGIIMTKLDGTAKGGIAMAVAEKLKLPILRIGVGEQVDDLQEFNAKDFCRALVGESN